MKVVISQSNYVPWKGYFELIANADIFIFLDNVQYTKNDWRNRNKIITDKGVEWITIPINNSITEDIDQKQFINNIWKRKHYKTVYQNYCKAPFFLEYEFLLEHLYTSNRHTNLSEYNIDTIQFISKNILKLNTEFMVYKSDKKFENPNDRLIDILLSVGADYYVTGPAAKNYINEEVFQSNKINVQYFEYGPYKPYKQRNQSFIDNVSILDTIFSCGPYAREYITSNNRR